MCTESRSVNEEFPSKLAGFFFSVITYCLLTFAPIHKLAITKHVLSPIYSIVYILYRPTEIEVFSKKSLHCFMLEMRIVLLFQ